MSINGNNNIVGDGNTVHQGNPDARPDPNNPNAIECPLCHKPAWAKADYCPCGYNLLRDRIAAHNATEVAEQNRKFRRNCVIMLVFMSAVMAYMASTTAFLRNLFIGLSITSLVLAVACHTFNVWKRTYEQGL